MVRPVDVVGLWVAFAVEMVWIGSVLAGLCGYFMPPHY
jgi:hypothetical protein